MPTLLLLRHAKSDWGDPGLPDQDRPLAPRGQRAAQLIAQHLRDAAVEIDLVLCSTARRTRETWDGVRRGLAREPEVRFERAIYEASVATLLDLVRGIGAGSRTVLMIGHNPGMHALAAALSGDGDPDTISRLEHGYPTGALATLSFDGEWTDVEPKGARLEDFIRPRDLGSA